jgi:predicted secreted protein
MEASEHFEVKGQAGKPIDLPIANGPATGYSWRLELPKGVSRVEDGPERRVPAGQRLGGSSGGHIRVTAAAGDYVIEARLVRPWEPNRPARVVEIRLHVR